MAFLTANWIAIVAAVAVALLGWNNRDAIKAKLGLMKDKVGDGELEIGGKISELIASISNLGPVKAVSQDIDDLRRTLDSAMISKLRHRVDALPDEAQRTKGYDALDTLALIVLVPRETPSA